MTDAQLQNFINSFDADNFDPADYSIGGNSLDSVNTWLSGIKSRQAEINKLTTSAVNKYYKKAVNSQNALLKKYNQLLEILDREDQRRVSSDNYSDVDAVGKFYSLWQVNAQTRDKLEGKYGVITDKKHPKYAEYTKAAKLAKTYEEKYNTQRDTAIKRYTNLKASTEAKLEEYETKALEKAGVQIADYQKDIDKYIGYIADKATLGTNQISDNLERDLGYIVEKIDAIDRLQAEQYDEYAGEGSKDGVDKQLIANKDKYIADNYAKINERLGMLSSDLGLYGAKLPAEFTTLDDIKQYYNDAVARSKDSKEDIGDILAGYVNEKVTPEQQAFITNAMSQGISSDDPDYISQLVSNIGAPTIAPPPPTAESAEVLRAYNQRPEDRETEPLKDMTLYNQYIDSYDQQVSDYLKNLESYAIYGGPKPKEPVFTPIPDEALEAFRGPESARETFLKQFDVDDYLRKTGLWSKGAEDYAKTFGEAKLNDVISNVAFRNNYDINKLNQKIAEYKPVSAEEAAKVADQLFRSIGAPNADFFPIAGQQIKDIIQTRGIEFGTSVFNSQNYGQQFSQGPGGLSLLQARRLATEIGLSRPNTGLRDSRTGEIVEDPLNFLTNAIYNQGWDAVFSQLTSNDEEGIKYAGNIPFIYEDTFVPRAQAEEFAKEMVIANVIASRDLKDDSRSFVSGPGISLDEIGQPVLEKRKTARDKALEIIEKENLVPQEKLITFIINQGVDETIADRKAYLEEAYPEVAARWSMPTEYVNTFKESLPQYQEAFLNDQQDQFYNNIQTILDGGKARPEYNYYGSAKSLINQIEKVTGQQNLDDQGWEDYFNRWGSDFALATFDQRYGDVYGRGEQFVSSGISELPTPYTPPSTDIDLSGYPTTGTPTTAYPTTGTPTTGYPTTGYPTTGTPTTGYPTTGYPSAGVPTIGVPTTGYPTIGVPTGGGLPTTTYAPAPYTPPPLLAALPERPTLTPTQQLIGAPEIPRPVGAPMQALTPQQAASQFTSPTQEDYFAYFGYTPEQLNAEQYLAELEGAPRAGVAAQTIPVLPPAVLSAPAPTGMKEGGMPQDAQRLADQGRNGDSMLVHMTPDEVSGLQSLAERMGGSLTINPQTGLPEANFFSRVGRGLKKLARNPLVQIGVAALAAPYLPAIAGSTAVTAGLLAGAGTMLGGGSLQQGLQRGLMAGMGASAAQSMGYQGIPGVNTPAQTAALQQSGGSALGAGVGSQNIGVENALYETAPRYTTPLESLAPPPVVNNPSAPWYSKVGDSLSNMDWKDAAMLGYVGLSAASLQENKQAQREYDEYMAGLAAERQRKKAAGTAAFERAFAAEGGLMRLAQGGMTYAEGGGTTGATNEPRMVKGTGDGMSDSVPATIEGVQEARLANDEFVVPADVVADLGNGSSSAGAQQLYDMMDRVRQARHGTTEQPPEIDVRKLMPA